MWTEEGFNNLKMILRRVVFPEPFGPMMAKKSPELMVKVTSIRTGVYP